MTNYNKTLHSIANKLGFGEDENILRKAAEYERLLQTKSIAGNNMSIATKVVICLDLAAATLGSGWDVKNAVKYSGLKTSAYANCRKTIQNLLELNSETVTVSSLCVSLQCAEIQTIAEKILSKYQSTSLKTIDTNIPQYVCMAVYQACRSNKIKISKNKFIEKSNLKPSQWSKLEQEMSKVVEEHFTKSGTMKEKNNLHEDIMALAGKSDNIPKNGIENNMPSVNQFLEPYEDWKKRMLEESYREINHDKAKKSPNKIMLKFSPYDTIHKIHQKLPENKIAQQNVKLTYNLK